jgi:hypothetical protein
MFHARPTAFVASNISSLFVEGPTTCGKLVAALIIALCGSSLALGQQRGELIPVVHLPPEVRSAADKAADDVKWLVSFKFAQPEQKTWYRIAGRDAQKSRLVMVMVFEGGEILDVRTETPMEEVPAAVNAAVKKAFPSFTPKKAEAVGKTMKSTIYYRFEGDINGTKSVLISRTDGTKVLQEGK